MSPLQASEELSSQLRELANYRTYVNEQITALERKYTDISHELERPRCLYAERARLATQLQKVLSERRAYKDWLSANKKILEFMDSDKGLTLQKWLDAFIGVARK